MKIKELKIASHDLAGTEAFYQGLLGLPVHYKDANQVVLRTGDTLIAFYDTDTGKPVYHIAIDIPGNKLEAACGWLAAKTEILPVSPGSFIAEFTNWNARSVYFYDNNGNILELICRLDLDNASDEDFSPSSFLHVSEIGLVTRDVPRLAAHLRKEYDLDFYVKQPPADNFTVLGDETGLFIIVSEHRHWFPTDRAAGIYPLAVVFDQKGKEETWTLKDGLA